METIENISSIVKLLMILSVILILVVRSWNIEKFMEGEQPFKTVGILISIFVVLTIAQLALSTLKFII